MNAHTDVPQPRWWRLMNPDDVDVSITHVAPGWGLVGDVVPRLPQHVVRVSYTDERVLPRRTIRTTVTADVELTPTPLGGQRVVAQFGAGTLFIHACEMPEVGTWQIVTEGAVLAAATGVSDSVVANIRRGEEELAAGEGTDLDDLDEDTQ